MVQAYILIQTEVGKAAQVASTISEITGVTKAEDVTGPYDVIVRAEAAENRPAVEVTYRLAADARGRQARPRPGTAPAHRDRSRRPSARSRRRCSHMW